jgi:hypothetical protein
MALSRDSWFDQRKDDALSVQLLHGLVNRVAERFGVGKGLMRQVVRLEIMPDLDVVEFRRILRQPLDGEPVCAGGKRRHREFARVDRAIVLDEHHRLDGLAGSGAIKPVELLKVGDEVAAALGRAGVVSAGVAWSSEPSIATFLACPGAGTRRSAPAFAQARAR